MFNERLRNAREQLNISQIQMAKKLGIAVTTYRNYENTTREPNYDILVNISKVLGVSIDYLLGNFNPVNNLSYIIAKCEKLSKQSQKDLESYIDYLIYKEKEQQ